MHAQTSSQPAASRAEIAFQAAFDRLKCGKPVRLPKLSKVSQNNVAREAGLDPSALKKARFPRLVAEIQRWIEEHADRKALSERQRLIGQRRRKRDLVQRNKSLKEQRDIALTLLSEADARILELTVENQRLRALSPSTSVIELSKGMSIARGSRMRTVDEP